MFRPVGWARATNCRSWCSDFVSPSLGTLVHHSTIPVLQVGTPEKRLEASDFEAQEVRGQALALLHLLGSKILIQADAVGSEATGGLKSSVLS